MNAEYDYIIKVGRWFLGRWTPTIAHRRGVFLGRSDNGVYYVVLDLSTEVEQ